MDIWKHSELSAVKFGGAPEDYLQVHKFLDSSKLFYFNVKHRALLHHTFGISLCIELLGDTLLNSAHKNILVRDIACEHLKEDLAGQVPTLADWFGHTGDWATPSLEEVQKINDPKLRDFILQPYVNSGIESSLLITFSDFGVALVQQLLGMEKALALRAYLPVEHTVKSILKQFTFTSRWQYAPDMNQLRLIKNQNHENGVH